MVMKVIAAQPLLHFHSHTDRFSRGIEPVEINRPVRLKAYPRSLIVSNCLNNPLNFNHEFQKKERLKYLKFKFEDCEAFSLPIVVKYPGRSSLCFWDGNELKIVPGEGIDSFSFWDSSVKPKESFRKLRGACRDALRNIFLPVAFRDHYLDYVKWKFLHRVFSSALQVLATQAMFRAIGIGYSRSLPSAAAFNWVLKDGLGRLSRCIYTAAFASAFDTNLKRLRFSTSVMFSLSIGVELLTPIFPRYFLLLATTANIAKQISLACYLATRAFSPCCNLLFFMWSLLRKTINHAQSAVHRSFSVADNLGEVSAKAQIQTVCFDNIGLLLAATLNFVFRNDQRLLGVVPFVVYPFFSALDLFGIYQALKRLPEEMLHLLRRLQDTLESIINIWIERDSVPSPAEVSKFEDICHLWRSKGRRPLPIRIGCLNLVTKMPKLPLMMSLKYLKEEDVCFICMECFNNDRKTGEKKKFGILLSLRDGATAPCIVSGLLQACYVRKRVVTERAYWETELEGGGEPSDSSVEKWMVLMNDSKEFADDNLDGVMKGMEGVGWACGNILLTREERVGYTIPS